MKQEFVPPKKPGFNFRLLFKIVITTAFATAAAAAAVNIFFLEELAESKLSHMRKTATAVSAMISELAVNDLEAKSKRKRPGTLRRALEKIHNEKNSPFHISVILYPQGEYYASTSKELLNKKAGRNLLKKIELNDSFGVEKLNYERDGERTPVLQFLQNVYAEEQGEKKRIATSQILFYYEKILKEAGDNLWKAAGIVYVFMMLIILAIFLPISRAHREIIKALNEVSLKNFQYTLPTRNRNELGTLFNSFNRMTTHLQLYFQKKPKSLDPKISAGNNPWNTVNTSLRKSEISCLCARLPEIKDHIENKSVNSITIYINRFLQSFEKGAGEFGGHIVKVMGDRVYAAFEGMNSVDNAIKAAVKINRKWRAFNHENKVLNIKRRNYGMGLHYGKELAGTIANPSFGYSFVGEVADIAGSLCLWAEREQILITSGMMSKAVDSYPSKSVDNPSVHPSLRSGDVLSLIVEVDLDQKLYNAETLKDDIHSVDINGKTFDSSLTDMLEETLKLNPLELLDDKKDAEGQASLSDKEDRKRDSLWDRFDSYKDKG